MSRAGSATRARVIDSAKERMRRHGVGATSMLDAIADAGASRGSLYHYFPGGKAQLIDEATAAAADEYSAAFAMVTDLDAEQAMPLVVESWRQQIQDSGYEAGCPVAAAALAGAEVGSARDIAGEAFSHWASLIEQVLANSGIPSQRLRPMATLVLSAIEGAVLLGLAQKSTEPMELIADELIELVRAVQA